MQGTFQSIADFLKIKDQCVFCKSKMKNTLTNFTLGPDNIPLINAKSLDDRFLFEIGYVTGSYTLAASTSVDINTNILNFNLTTPVALNGYGIEYMMAKTVFENHKPHIELYCPNKKCKMKYGIQSDVFRIDRLDDSLSRFKIRPFILYMESFVLDKLWVQNDWINTCTYIYAQNNLNIEPIKVDLLNLEEMGKEKIINRVRTLVTFS